MCNEITNDDCCQTKTRRKFSDDQEKRQVQRIFLRGSNGIKGIQNKSATNGSPVFATNDITVDHVREKRRMDKIEGKVMPPTMIVHLLTLTQKHKLSVIYKERKLTSYVSNSCCRGLI